MCVGVYIFTNTSARTSYEARSIFKSVCVDKSFSTLDRANNHVKIRFQRFFLCLMAYQLFLGYLMPFS